MLKETENTINALKGESDPLSIPVQSSLYQSLIPGTGNEYDENQGLNEGNAGTVNDKLKYLLTSDECRDEAEQPEEAKEGGEEKDNQNIRIEEKGHKKKPHKASKGEKDAPGNVIVLNEIRRSALVFLWQVLFHDRYLSVTTTQKALVFVILLSGQHLIVAASASPTQHTKEPSIAFEYKVLETSSCDLIGFWKPNECERNENIFQIYIDWCGLADKCDPGFKPMCIQEDEGEAIYFCSPVGLSCKEDGSCVSPCDTGYTRDVNGGFRCKEIHDVEYQHETDKKVDAKDAKYVDGYETLIEKSQMNMTTPAEYIAMQDWHKAVVIVLVSVALLFVVASIVHIYNIQNERLVFGGRFY